MIPSRAVLSNKEKFDGLFFVLEKESLKIIRVIMSKIMFKKYYRRNCFLSIVFPLNFHGRGIGAWSAREC